MIFQRRRPRNVDSPAYKEGSGPPRGMQPPIVMHDMRAMERSWEENFRQAWERKRLQEEAREEGEDLNPQPRRQSACDRDLEPCVDLEVQPEQAVSKAGKGLKGFEVLQEQSNKKRKRPDLCAERLGREGIFKTDAIRV